MLSGRSERCGVFVDSASWPTFSFVIKARFYFPLYSLFHLADVEILFSLDLVDLIVTPFFIFREGFKKQRADGDF